MDDLSENVKRFIVYWGELGARWGVNRTVAQIHALLYISPKPLNADQIAKALSLSRSNVGASLHELESWRLVRGVRDLGGRSEHFEPVQDAGEMFRIVVEERKKREIDPTVNLLRETIRDLQGTGREGYARERLEHMLGFLESMMAWYEDLRRLPTGTIRRLSRLRGKVDRLLGAGAAT